MHLNYAQARAACQSAHFELKELGLAATDTTAYLDFGSRTHDESV
jgi:hypothetical protein